jgi:hypothetical protein
MRSILFSLAFVAMLLLPGSDRASADSMTLASRYDVSGTNPDGSQYKGKADVEVISKTTFTIKWMIGGSIYEGFGMRMNDTLAATYTINGEPGLVIYRVDGNGLDGLWAIRGHNRNGTEHLTPQN